MLKTPASGTTSSSQTFTPFSGASFNNDCLLQPMLHINHLVLQFVDNLTSWILFLTLLHCFPDFITARRYACAVYAVVVCPFVCPSVRLSHAGIVPKRLWITQTTPHDSPWILVFYCQKSPRNSDGVTPNGSAQ